MIIDRADLLGVQLGDCPFVGSRPFDERDHAFFGGRDHAVQIIAANVNVSPLTVLYGASGVGKTSILRAGVVPYLRHRRGRTVVYFDDWLDVAFAERLRTMCAEAMHQAAAAARHSAGAAGMAAASPAVAAEPGAQDFVRTLVEASQQGGGPLLLVLDQFEDYLESSTARAPADGADPDTSFDSWLATIINREDIRANVLLGLKEDCLSRLDRFRARIPGLLSNTLRLDPLMRQEAGDAVRAAMTVYNDAAQAQQHGPEFRVEIDATDDPIATAVDGAARGSFVQAAALQVLMKRLWMVETERWNRSGRATHRVLRGSTIEALGGALRIIDDDLNERLQRLSVEERDLAVLMFHYLITPSGVRIAYSASDLAFYIDSKSRDVRPKVDQILNTLEELRIVRPVPGPEQPGGGVRYEISSELLAESIGRVRRDWYPEPSDVIISGRKTFEYAVVRVEALDAVCEFDEEGSGVLERRWVGIRMAQTITDLRLPYVFGSSSDAVAEPEIELRSATGHRVAFVRAPGPPNVVKGQMIISGTLAADSLVDDLIIRQRFQNSFKMTRDVIAERYQDDAWQGEYAGTAAPFEVTSMTVTVKFPPSHHALTPPPEAVAFIGGSEQVFGRELARLRRSVVYANGVATLKVSEPAPNVLYGISWLPPSKPSQSQ